MNRQRRSEILNGYLFVAPNLIAMLVFVCIPIAVSLGMSFTNWNLIETPKFIGLANYTDTMMKDQQFWTSLKNTAIFSVLSIPFGMLFSLFFALLLNQALRGITLYRALVFLPVVVSMISVSRV